MLTLTSFGLSLFLNALIVGLISPRATLVEFECTKSLADRFGKLPRELLHRVTVDEHFLRLIMVSFLDFRSDSFFDLFSAEILSESKDSIFELR